MIGKSAYFSLLPAVLLTALLAGCSKPSDTLSLDEVLEREGFYSQSGYNLRCTAGAHRGASVEFRENTKAALSAADRNDRFAFIEFDVQYSKDRRIVVYHDKRMLRLFGSLKAVGETNYTDLVEISDGEIAAYDEIIGTLKKKLNIEIKSQGDSLEDNELADELIADLTARKREDDILISSISGEVITYIKEKYPEIPTGQIFWLTSSTYLPFEHLTRNLYKEIAATKADYLILHVANLHNLDDLISLKPKNKTLVFWDFDDNIYVLHKDLSDRLWGESAVSEFFQAVRYKFTSLF